MVVSVLKSYTLTVYWFILMTNKKGWGEIPTFFCLCVLPCQLTFVYYLAQKNKHKKYLVISNILFIFVETKTVNYGTKV